MNSLPPSLAAVACGRDILHTYEAAQVLNRSKQTLLKWSCLECGPIRPIRINRRLAWKVADIAAVLNGEVQ